MEAVFLYLSLIIIIAAILTVLFKFIKQPPIIAYLLTGVIVGPLVFGFISPGTDTSNFIQIFAHLGVALLLFIVGLSLDFRVLKEVGKVATTAGIIEIISTALISFLIVLGFGFGITPALYIAVALAFSSTVVVVKILSDKKEIDTLHGKIALGILIVEDFVASIALMVIPLIENKSSFTSILISIILVTILIALVIIITKYALSRILDYLARSQEVLFLSGIAWAFALAALFYAAGFSLEIGALIAGMSLASSKYTTELGAKIKPLRDFFVMLFFIFFGSQLTAGITLETLTRAIILSAFIMLGKPIIIMSILRISGYKKRTNFLAGSSLAQISEFSLILILLGFTLGHVNQETMNLVVLIAIITIGISSYSIYYAHNIFEKLKHLLWMFEGRKKEEGERKQKEYDVILFGYHRIGYKIGQELKRNKIKFLVVDYNPKVVINLADKKIDAVYGDASDTEFLEEIWLDKAKIIISTIPDEHTNLNMQKKLQKINPKAAFIATAEQPRNAIELYEAGADYVIIPHHLGGDYIAKMIESYKDDKDKYSRIGRIHKKELLEGRNKSKF